MRRVPAAGDRCPCHFLRSATTSAGVCLSEPPKERSSALTRITIRTHFSMTPEDYLKTSSFGHLDGTAMTMFPR